MFTVNNNSDLTTKCQLQEPQLLNSLPWTLVKDTIYRTLLQNFQSLKWKLLT